MPVPRISQATTMPMSSVSVGPGHARRAEAAHQALDRAPVELPLKSATASTISCSSGERRLRMGCATDGCRGCGVPSSRAKNPRRGAAGARARAGWTRPRDTNRPPRPRPRQSGQTSTYSMPSGEKRVESSPTSSVRPQMAQLTAGEAPVTAGRVWRNDCSSPGRAGGRDARTQGARVLNKYVGDRRRHSGLPA